MKVAAALGTLFLVLQTASAAASGGWYLLVPPLSAFDERASFLEGFKILEGKPLSQWSQQGAYDSASECEGLRSNLTLMEQNVYSKSNAAYLSALGEKKDEVVLKMMRWTTERENANVNALSASRCIKSDDPRLAK